MKMPLTVFLSGLLIFSFTATAQQKISREAEAFFQRAMTEIKPDHITWIKRTALSVNSQQLDENAISQMATNYGAFGNLNDADIEALCFLVMMAAAKDANEDLKNIMGEVKSINDQKQKLREANDKLNDKNLNISRVQLDSFKLLVNTGPAAQNGNTTIAQPDRTVRRDSTNAGKLRIINKPVSNAEIDHAKETIKNKLDSMSEMGETESLRLQMAMDRQSKFMSTLSNLLKKISETEESIIQNLK